MVGKVLICLLLAVVLAVAQNGGSFNIDPSGTIKIKQGAPYSDWIFIETSVEPDSNPTLSWSEANDTPGGNPSGNIQFTSSSCQFSSTVRSCSFRLTATNTNGSFAIQFTSSDPTNWPAPGNINVEVDQRTITFEGFPTSPVFVNQPSPPIQIRLSEASPYSLTFTPQTLQRSKYLEDQYLIITPNPITINPNSLVGEFTYQAINVTGPVFISWSITGQDQLLYVDGSSLNQMYQFDFSQREVTTPDFGVSAEAILGPHGDNWLYAYVRQTPNSSLTLTPNAADTMFYPSTLSITNGLNWARFEYNTTSPEAQKIVYWTISSNDNNNAYADVVPTTINVPLRTVYITPPSALVLTNTSQMSIAIPYPTPNDLKVCFYASQASFPTGTPDPCVEFTSANNVTSFVVPILPLNLGADRIYFRLDGADAAWYQFSFNIPPGGPSSGDDWMAVPTITNGLFTSASNWYTPMLYMGQQSPQIPVRVALSPRSNQGVTLTPSAPNLRFDPATLTFRNGSEQQYFRITPVYTDSNSYQQTVTVNFLLSGPDHPWFAAPDPMQVTVSSRVIQTDWSAHLTNTWQRFGGTAADCHLGKTYKVWVTANYVGSKDTVTVTPVSPYFSFNPKVIKFTGGSTRTLLEATVTGVVGSTNIDYIIGGAQGGYYAPIGADTVNTLMRPLQIQAAQLAPDTRLPHKKAGYVDWPDFSASTHLSGQWTVYSFKIRSSVLPDNGLTITPQCPHAKFHPSSISLGGKSATKHDEYDVNSDINIVGYNSGHSYEFEPMHGFTWFFNNSNLYLEANFTVQPLAGGTHVVNFALSGKDAGFYQVPADTPMRFRTVDRDSNEPVQNAAGAVLPSIAVFVFAIVAMFL